MPKVSTGKTEKKHASPHVLILKYGQKRVMCKRHKSFNLMLDTAHKHFPVIPRDVITLQTDQLDVCDGHYADITDDTWSDVMDLITLIDVTRGELPILPPPVNNAISLPDKLSEPELKVIPAIHLNGHDNSSDNADDDKITVNVDFHKSYQTHRYSVKISKATLVRTLLDYAARRKGYRLDDFNVLLDGSRVNDDDLDLSIGSYNIGHAGYTIDLLEVKTGGKPVIYLYSPSDIDVSVTLSLSPEWNFSAIYPVVTTKQDTGQHVEWNVRTHQDGNLTENNSGREVSYLFWEAKTNLVPFPRSQASEPQPAHAFSPIYSTLGDTDSIVIPVHNVTVYLDKSLKVLGLHTEARTSFITYWLPSILKHEYIALRFVPQLAYERAASLIISPEPDVVTRIFMLFKGVREEELANWSTARMQVEKDVAWWADVVGVDLARASDTTLFRVLEWGGMEVRI